MYSCDMFSRFLSAFRGLLIIGFLAGAAAAAEPEQLGHVFTYKSPGGFKFEVRKVRELERVEGFYTARLFNGTTERFDAFNVGGVVDLRQLTSAEFRQAADLAEAKALEQRTAAVIKHHPLLAPHVAPHLARLRADIARAERGERKIEGRWMTAQQVAEMNAGEQSTVKRGVLKLRNGTSYRDVEIVSVNKQELRIMHADGAAKIPMHLVPEDFQREFLKGNQAPAPK
jgi:hypothetical protein